MRHRQDTIENVIERFARVYEAGTVLFREGDRADVMYVIQSGDVEVRRQINGEDRVLAVLPAGEFLGEMAIINARPRSATAVVRNEATLLVIEPKTFEAMIRGRTEIAVRMIKALATRLERANQQIELLLLRSANHRVVECLRHLAEEFGRPNDEMTTYLPVTVEDIAKRVALRVDEVEDVLGRLVNARLVIYADDVGLGDIGFVIPEVGRLLEFLEFLELKERFGSI